MLESTRNTVTIHHGENGTAEKTTVDTNPEKVLEHENLLTDYGISKTTTGNTTKLGLQYTRVEPGFDLNNLENGRVRCENFVNCPTPQEGRWLYVSSFKENTYAIQEAIALVDDKNTTYRRTKQNGVWGEWREQVGDKSVIDALLSQKQDKLTAGTGITIQGHTISATGCAAVDGATLSIQDFMVESETGNASVIKHVVTIGQQILTTFLFNYAGGDELVITGELKEELKAYLYPNDTQSSGAISISYDGRNIKLMNSKSTEHAAQHATCTFYEYAAGGDAPN